jgi:hypothetical protein
MFPHALKDVFAYSRLKTTVLGNRLTDGGEVVSLTPPSPFTRKKIPGTHFY